MRDFLIIVPEGGMLFESTGIADLLQWANKFLTDSGDDIAYQVTIATTQSHHVVHGYSGLKLLANTRLIDLDPTIKRHTIMVTGRGGIEQERSIIADWLRLAAPNAIRTASICGGALLLAQAGLLEHRKATTHWRLINLLAEQYPNVSVERGPMFVQDGPVWTSAGVTAGFDLTLAMIEQDCGYHLARDVAQEMVMFLRCPGGQAQFSRYRLPETPELGPIRDLQIWIQEHLNHDLSIERLADRVSMSPRNFARVFSKQTGITPAKYIEEIRLNAARDKLEQSMDRLERIAQDTGLGNSLNLRRVFERHLQVTPKAYRERFAIRQPSAENLS
ncbi:GlxA family transcriptional regulator [Agarivorans sp. Z349TD_8]|uniref:GlxA family transcriptional regulator n=1 Tax=Agarivorans sp. Z349TD_8 TaxID=3421434 RepID=UPI003D7C7873